MSIVKNLRIKSDVMSMGERIAWGSDTALMREAADEIERLEKIIKRCREWESEVGTNVSDILAITKENERIITEIAKAKGIRK